MRRLWRMLEDGPLWARPVWTFVIVLGVALALGFCISLYEDIKSASAAQKVYAKTPPKPLALDVDKAFSEFRMRQLGLPSVWYYPEKNYPEKYRPVKEE